MTPRRWAIGLVTLAVAGAVPAGAGASHGPPELLSTGPTGGNGALTAPYAGTSADGDRVFFETLERLVAADTDSRTDVYERAAGVTSLVSTGPAGGNGSADAFFYGASADGSVVFFGTSERLTAGDTDSASDVYERASGATSLVSTGATGGNGPQGAFFDGASDDGAHVFFHTAERLTAADTDSQNDVYERAGGTTALVSAGSGGGGNGAFPAFFDGSSADGTRVFFDTDEPLVPGDGDAVQDVYERSAGGTTLLSTGPDGGNGPRPAFFDAASEDGTRVVFSTEEILAEPDFDDQFDVYVRDGGLTKVASTAPDTGNDAFDALYVGASHDVGRVFFETAEPFPGDGDSNVDVYERSGLTTTRRSAGQGAFDALFAGAAADGSHVLYETEEQVLAQDTDAGVDVYDSAGATALVSTGPDGGNGATDAFFADVSEDGGRVFFTTAESLVAGDSDTATDVYERAATATSVVSSGGNGSFNASFAGASANGDTAIFTTSERLAAGDTDSSADVYAARVLNGYARPKGASPLRVSLVPAYQQCTAPNRTHGPPLAFGSCAPPQQVSQGLTVGTIDANGQPAASLGFLRLAAKPGDPGTPGDQADVAVSMSITDVREQTGLADYTGEVTGVLGARLTDRDGPATTAGFTFDVPAQCTATATGEGGTCSAITTFDALVPGSVVEGSRAIWALDAVAVTDAQGAVFARQGIFVP